MILTFGEMADLVGHAVALELGAMAEDECSGAQAIAEWASSHEGPEREALAALISGLAAEALAAMTLTNKEAA